MRRFRIGAGAGSYSDDPVKRKPLAGNQFRFPLVQSLELSASARYESYTKLLAELAGET